MMKSKVSYLINSALFIYTEDKVKTEQSHKNHILDLAITSSDCSLAPISLFLPRLSIRLRHQRLVTAAFRHCVQTVLLIDTGNYESPVTACVSIYMRANMHKIAS